MLDGRTDGPDAVGISLETHQKFHSAAHLCLRGERPVESIKASKAQPAGSRSGAHHREADDDTETDDLRQQKLKTEKQR